MEKVHFNCKAIKLELNGKVMDFPSKVKLQEFLFEEHGLGATTIRLIIKSGEPYKPRQHALKHLTGMRIYYPNGGK